MTQVRFAATGNAQPQHWGWGQTPVGRAWVAWHGDAICALGFNAPPATGMRDDHAAQRWLDAICAEPARTLTVAPAGTDFQRRVWQALTRIPRGATCSYAEVARMIAAPGASRAVGGACGANPIAILIPCHRVLRGDGALGGYSGGLVWKRRLLAWEGVAVA
jgi:O-6-methylguanine DNA methyltransferase